VSASSNFESAPLGAVPFENNRAPTVADAEIGALALRRRSTRGEQGVELPSAAIGALRERMSDPASRPLTASASHRGYSLEEKLGEGGMGNVAARGTLLFPDLAFAE